MGGFLVFILLIPLFLICYLAFKYRHALLSVYKLREQYREAQRRAEEEQERQERVRKRQEPSQSSVEMIDDAALDLEGGEYVEYEEVE